MEFLKLKILLPCLLLVQAVALYAGNGFSVSSFKRLDWDLDARVNYPVKDQNSRKAALIKVVTADGGRFAFDVGMMGIVKQEVKDSEVWLYVPEGVRKISISHPEYGLIRDFDFGQSLESGTVYELRLDIPQRVEEKLVVLRDTLVRDSIVYKAGLQYPSGLRLALVGAVPDFSWGAAIGYDSGKWGAYLKWRSNYVFPSWSLECSSDGTNSEGYVWTDGSSQVSTMLISAGLSYNFLPWMGLSLGAGYGKRLLLWKDIDGRGVKVTDRSFEGFTAEVGAIFTYKHAEILLGTSLVGMHYLQFEMGVGWHF